MSSCPGADFASAFRYAWIARARRHLTVLSVLVLFATPWELSAQETIPPTITGVVRLRLTSTAIPDASVQLEGTAFVTRTDSLGRYTLRGVPPGPHVLLVRRLGYAASRVPVTVPASGSVTIDITMATSALQLEQVRVTGDMSGRARGELGTATVLDRDAIANQIASSLQGVLELVPGVPIQPPGLDAAAQFSLRSLGLGTTGSSGGVSGPGASSIGASGTLIILDGIPLSNNANLQTVGPRGEALPVASTAGGGIDLRRIPASTLERVEVIRGVPSARWGDLTQGAIVVDTRAAATAPELQGRYDPRTSEGSIVGGRAVRDGVHSFTVSANLARTASARTTSNNSTYRGAGQLAHRMLFGVAPGDRLSPDGRTPLPKLSFDTRLDWYLLRYDAPERIDIAPGRSSFQDDNGIRLGERARLALGSGTLEWTAAYDVQSQETRETRRMSRATVPFTDRLTEGRNIGTYVEGLYSGDAQLLGAPRMLYSRLEYDRRSNSSVTAMQIRFGGEIRREWNTGEGYQFAIDRPPQTSPFNGTAGFDRPHSFDTIPALATSGWYADTRFSVRRGEMFAEVQPGVRLETLHERGAFTGVRSSQLQPRLTMQVSPRPWARLRGGYGVVSKVPTLAQLHPAHQYYDLVNVNRYTPDPNERLAVVTTFIRDPSNPDLGLSRATKRELGLELDGGARWGSLSLTWFNDHIRGAVTLRRDPSTLQRARYALADTGIGTGQPGRIIDPPIGFDPVPIFLDRYVNGGRLDSRGVEFVAILPNIPDLRTRLELSGATMSTSFATDDRDFGSLSRLGEFQVDTVIKRVPYTSGARSHTRQSILTWRLIHHQPDVGLVITTTLQQRLGFRRQSQINGGDLWFEGYLDREGNIVPVPASERDNPEYADLRAQRPGSNSSTTTQPNDWVLSLQIAKSLGRSGRMSFYIFNATDKFVTFNAAGSVRALPSSRFGAEMTLPLGDLFGGAR